MKENKFKSPISIDGYLKIKNSGVIPDTPTNGDIKLFIKEGKLFQVDDTGTQSEVGSGSSISGKVVTGIESGQDKIVISFSDGTQEEIKVITDIPVYEYMTSEEARDMIESIWNEVELI